MFLTKKSIIKTVLVAACFFALGSVCIAFYFLFKSFGIKDIDLLIFAAILYSFCLFSIYFVKYSEGKGKIIRNADKLVRKELKPADFIKQYEILNNSTDLVVKKPSFEVLYLLLLAYDSLNDEQNSLAAADKMIEIANEKKKPVALLLKAGILFSNNKIEQAEQLFSEVQKQKLNIAAVSMVDVVRKTDRAFALEDYKTVEEYYNNIISMKLPKNDNLTKLIINYKLGEVYEKTGQKEKAVTYYKYCVNFGGETAIKNSATEKLLQLS